MGHQLEDVYDELAPSVLGYLRGRGCRDPEAVCGDVFVRVATKLSGFRGGDAALRRWVFTIAHNCLVDELKSASRQREIVAGELPETGLATASQEIDHELLGALGHLTDDQRDVIVLRYVADLPTRDVAKILGKRQGAIKMLQARGLATLRTALEELGRDA